jgi:hypothetical protein
MEALTKKVTGHVSVRFWLRSLAKTCSRGPDIEARIVGTARDIVSSSVARTGFDDAAESFCALVNAAGIAAPSCLTASSLQLFVP